MTTVFEEQNIPKAILRMGLPAMLGQLTTLIYNIADTFFVSLTKEPATIAAVTLCTPILLIIMSIASIFGMGGNSVIARLLGECYLVLSFASGNTKAVLKVMDGAFYSRPNFIGIVPFDCATQGAGICPQAFFRIDINHPSAGR